jgi:hypothetical protein
MAAEFLNSGTYVIITNYDVGAAGKETVVIFFKGKIFPP